jgi:uncharacterized protein YkwD
MIILNNGQEVFKNRKMKHAGRHRRIFWAAAATLVFGCSLTTGSIPGALERGSAKDLAAFLPPSNTPFLPDFNNRTASQTALPGDPPTATFTIVLVFTETVTPTSSPTATLMMFPSQTPTATVTIYILPTVTPTSIYQPRPSPTPTRKPNASPTPTVRIADPDTATPLPTDTLPGGGDQPTATPTGTPLPMETATGQPSATPIVLPTAAATITLQPTATKTAVPTGSDCVVYNYEYESQVVSLLNAQRTQNGLSSLSVNNALTNSARGHSIDMVTHNLTQHNGSDGSTPRQRMIQAGYTGSWWGEIIYWGSGSYGTPSHAVTWWMNDPPHKEVILGSHYTDFGVGYVSCSSFTYKGFFTVDFGGP